MDYLSDQFIAFLRKLGNQLAEIKNAIKEQTESQANKGVSTPAAESKLESFISYKKTEDSKTDEREERRARIELYTLIAVVIYAAVATFQWTEMRKATTIAQQSADTAARAYTESRESFERTMKQMQGQTDAQVQAADAATKAANIAKSASDTSREALTSVQRAIIAFAGISAAGKKIVAEKIESYTADYEWQNLGMTPTKRASSWVSLSAVNQVHLPNDFNYPDLGEGQPNQFVVIPKYSGHGYLDVPAAAMDAAVSGRGYLISWGWMAYHDVFNGTPTRLTEFCLEVVDIHADRDVYDPAVNVSWRTRMCPTHNCVDEECSDYATRIKGK